MKKKLMCVLLVLVLSAAVNWAGCSNRSATTAQREKLTRKFMACLPDSLDDARREEIQALFDMFWKRAERELVYPEDIEVVTSKLRQYVKAGRITPSDLLYYMAQVGYFTYRMDPRYNLPEGVPDHPTINPDAALVEIGRDSLGNFTGCYLPRKTGADTTKKEP